MEEFISPFKGLAMSTATAKLNKALSTFQALCPPIPKDKKKRAGQKVLEYASLAKTLEVVIPQLAKQGLSLTQHVVGGALVTRLAHESGEWLASSMQLDTPNIPGANEAQKAGGAITYACRYALSAFLALSVQDDLDADDAPKSYKMAQRQTPAPKELSKEHIAAKNDLLDLVQGTDKEESTAKWLESNPSILKINQLIKKLQ